MKDYSHIISKMTSTPWMITQGALEFMIELIEAHMDGTISQDEIRARLAAAREDRGERRQLNHRGVGILPLDGPIFPKANLMTELSGATSVAQFRSDFRALMSDDSVSSILLQIDSPGGHADQIEEMGNEIFAAREVKPVWAIADTSANSAAYWLGTQAERFMVTPSGQVGSVGVYVVHTDKTKQKEMLGVKDTVIHAGRFKAVGQSELDSEDKAVYQNHVDQLYEVFVDSVARGRNVSSDVVKKNFGEGFVITAREAADKNMVDGIATYDEVLSEMIAPPVVQSTKEWAAATSRVISNASYDADKEHSEPGTGEPPAPRIPEPEEGDLAIAGGWRRDPTPLDQEESQAMSREQLEALAAKLGVTYAAEISDEDLTALVLAEADEFVTPIAEAAANVDAQRSFEKDYPEQAEKLRKLEVRDRETSSKSFAAKFESLPDRDGDGLSALMLDAVEDAHLKIIERTFMGDDLETLILGLTNENAIVHYGETGSARAETTAVVRAGADRQEIRRQTAKELERIMIEDGLDQKAALKVLSETQPELFAAYKAS